MLGDTDSCQCDCPETTLIVMKGDDLDFSRNNPVYLRVFTRVDLTGLKLHFNFFDYCTTIDAIPEDGKIPIVFTAQDTKNFPVGRNYGKIWLEDETGKVRSVTKKIIIDVRTDPEESYANPPVTL